MSKYHLYKVLRHLYLISENNYERKLAKYDFKKTKNYKTVANSTLFDADWYLDQNPDVKEAGVDPVWHYLNYGWKEGRNPSLSFDGNGYLALYDDLKRAKICPLIHYERYGRKEGRGGSAVKEDNFQYDTPSFWDRWVCKRRSQTPKISVIVASYNYQDYIKETLDSLANQTYKNYEVIIVDDGSADRSVEVIEKYTRKYDFMKLYQHAGGENRGLIETIQLGLEKSTGEYIAFCESDDYWAPNHLEEKVKIITSFAKANVITNDICLFGSYQKCIQMEQNVLRRVRLRFRHTINHFTYADFRKENWIPTLSCCMIKKEVLLSCNLADNPRPSATDWWIYRQLVAKGNAIFYVPQQLTYWRIHNSYNATQVDDYKLKQSTFNKQSDLVCGWKQGQTEENKMLKTIEKSPLFDAAWYQETYQITGVNPAAHYLYCGWKEGYNPSEKFDGNLYLSFYDDVKTAEMNPLLHYEMFGKGKRWKVAAKYDDLDVLILTSVRKTDGVYIWRVNFLKEFFEKNHYTVSDETVTDLSRDFLNKLYHAKLVIFNRPHRTGMSAKILKELTKHKKNLIIDIDDLLISDYAAYSGRYKSGKISYDNTVNNMLIQSLCYLYSPKMTVSTELLAKEMARKFEVHTAILPNQIAETCLKKKEKDTTEGFKLLYASGSETHGYDASTVYLDLFNFMLKHEDVTLSFLGASTFQNGFSLFKDRVCVIKYSGFEQMLDTYAKHDLLLVPLDKNPFNNAKSNIKYIEAGAVGTPVLARDCDEFTSVIKDGVNGFLYQHNFYEKLEQIYQNRKELYKVGERAYLDVVKNHSTNTAINPKVKDFLC